ncbi:MAG TPA: four helix bundle protein [Vicinamibacterales bacterium]|nr:four helix bundle protein [Vicinamibacterales bacterium]
MSSTYRSLDVWQEGMRLVEQCYAATRAFPHEELFGLTSQLRRAAVSIPSNVAEGACRNSDRAFCNHVAIALGSHGELETCLEIGRRLGYVSDSVAEALEGVCSTTGRLLNGLHRSLRRKIKQRRRPRTEPRTINR